MLHSTKRRLKPIDVAAVHAADESDPTFLEKRFINDYIGM
jgi:hypothetical protein